MRRWDASTRLTALAVLTPGCLGTSFLDDGRELDSPLPCVNTPITLEPGQPVEGQDPEALLAPYLGTWSGTLTWTTGGDTAFELGVARGTSPAYAGRTCTRPTHVYIRAETTLLSADGALDQNGSGRLSVGLDGTPYRAEQNGGSPLHLDGILQPEWTSALPAQLPVDPTRYVDSLLTFSLQYATGAVAPALGTVIFTGAPATMREKRDQLVVATIAFERP